MAQDVGRENRASVVQMNHSPISLKGKGGTYADCSHEVSIFLRELESC